MRDTFARGILKESNCSEGVHLYFAGKNRVRNELGNGPVIRDDMRNQRRLSTEGGRMERYYAREGAVPKLGEIWRPVGPKMTVLTVHLVDVEKVRPLVPPELTVKAFWPGKTIGGLVLSYYGPGSTLVYHELSVMPAWVKFAGGQGFWSSHLYVDSEKSLAGGRLMGFPKEMADFSWGGTPNDAAVISSNGGHICTVRYRRRFGLFRFHVGAPSVSIAEDKVMWMRHRFKACYGLCRVSFEVPDDSPLSVVPIGQPLMAIAGKGMTGFMAENQKVLGFLPHRAAPGAE